MSVMDFEIVLQHIADLITTQEIQGGHRPIPPDERLALALRFLATGESFHLLSFQFRISLRVVSYFFYIVEGCCDAIVKKMVPKFIPLPSSPNEWQKIITKRITLEHWEQ